MEDSISKGRSVLWPACAAALVVCLLAEAALAQAASTKSRSLDASAQLKRIAKPGPNKAVQEGIIRGTPFGSATMNLRSTLKKGRVTSTFTFYKRAGRVYGRASARLTLNGDTATYRGTATITGGTKRYKNVSGTKIKFTGKGPVSAKSVKVRLTGTVRY
jgi:hypothetical protein